MTRYPSWSLSVTSTRWLGSFTCGGWADSVGAATTWTATRVVWLRWGWPPSWARICTSWKNNSEWDSRCCGWVQYHIHTKHIRLHVSPICHTWQHGGKNSEVLVQYNSITNNHWSVTAYSRKLSHSNKLNHDITGQLSFKNQGGRSFKMQLKKTCIKGQINSLYH